MLSSEVAMTDAEKESEARCKEMLNQLIAVVKKQTLEIEELAESMKELVVGLKAVVQPPGATTHAWPLPVPAPTATLVTAVDHAVAAAAPRAEAALAPEPPTKCSTSGPDTNAGDLQVVAESDPETGVPTIAPALAEHSSAPSPKLFSTIKQDTLMPTRYSTICPDRSIGTPTSVRATAVPPTSSSTIATLEIGNTFIANTILMKSTECPMECEEHAVDTDRRVTAAGIGTVASTNCLRECPRLVAGDISVTNLVIVASVTCIMGLQLKSPWPPPEQDRSRGSAEKRPTPWPSLKCYWRGASLDSASDDYGDAITDEKFGPLKTMFSAFSSSYDPLDYHMIWHQRSILEAVGAFSANDLHILDLSFVYQLLCLGKCYWAIYVIIHMPHLDDAPYIHEKLIREILSQYCELWSKDKAQRQYIAELGIPAEWMHEALALYHEYYGDRQGALENFIQCGNWRKAHTIFMTSVAHSLFLSSNHQEIWDITSALENHKSEIADWDLGAGIYIDYYILRNSMQEESTMDDSDPLEKKNESCRSFFGRLNDSLLVWGSKLPVEARACYSKMAEELCELLMNSPGEGLAPNLYMGCFQTMLNAPVPDDHRTSYLQEAVSVFTDILCRDSC